MTPTAPDRGPSDDRDDWIPLCPVVPDGAQFHAQFAADKGLWFGSLMLPGRDGKMGVQFRGLQPTIIEVLSQCNERYREWLVRRKQHEPR